MFLSRSHAPAWELKNGGCPSCSREQFYPQYHAGMKGGYTLASRKSFINCCVFVFRA
jgi:hypothetical protein